MIEPFFRVDSCNVIKVENGSHGRLCSDHEEGADCMGGGVGYVGEP